MILVAVDDLLFSSKIRATGKQVGAELTFAPGGVRCHIEVPLGAPAAQS